MERLKVLMELMDASKLTLSEISRRSGVATSTVHRYVRGHVKEITDECYDSIYKVLNDESKGHSSEVEIDTDLLKQQMMSKTPTTTLQTYAQKFKIPHRGDIYYIKNPYASGNEQWGSRPAVVISNNKIYDAMGTVEVCYMTSKPKCNLPTHANVSTNRSVSIVLCEQIHTISKERIDKYFGKVSDEEMSAIESALLVSLDIRHINKERIIEVPNTSYPTDYEKLKVERDLYKKFYEDLVKIAIHRNSCDCIRNSQS